MQGLHLCQQGVQYLHGGGGALQVQCAYKPAQGDFLAVVARIALQVVPLHGAGINGALGGSVHADGCSNRGAATELAPLQVPAVGCAYQVGWRELRRVAYGCALLLYAQGCAKLQADLPMGAGAGAGAGVWRWLFWRCACLPVGCCCFKCACFASKVAIQRGARTGLQYLQMGQGWWQYG